jgi:hypothetical protein
MADEDSERALSRFLIAFEELRVRLAPFRYPNIEITDEGYLWFNADTSTNAIEVLAFPFGFQEFNSPSIAVSLPRRAEEVNSNLLDKLHRIADNINGGSVIAWQSDAVSEILHAFKHNEHPQLALVTTVDETPEVQRKAGFFGYLGVLFPVTKSKLADVERTIKEIIRGFNED